MDKIVVEDLDLFYGNFQALKKINVAFKEHENYRSDRTVGLR